MTRAIERRGLVHKNALGRASARDLLLTYGSILDELTTRRLVRTRDAPAGQLAERLAQVAFGGTLAPNAQRSWDCRLKNGTTLQVKCRVLGREKPNLRRYRQLSPFRSFDFDEALIILFDADYGIHRAARVRREVIEKEGRWSKHVNGRVIDATDALLKRGKNVTGTLAKALEKL